MKVFIALLVCLFCFSYTFSSAQDEKIKSYLKMVAAGKVDEVKRMLPDLLAEFPDNPGVQLLHGAVIDDAFRAVEIFERIIKKYPESDWTDDAYWRVVQFYAVIGDTARAINELEQYRRKFPNSVYLLAATDVVRTSLVLARSESKLNNTIYTLYEEGDSKKQSQPHQTQAKKADEAKDIKKEEPKKEETKKETAKKDDLSKGNWGLQVGIYSTEEAAETEQMKFQQLRLRTQILEKQVDGATMFAVVIGNYSSKEIAEQEKTKVQQQCSCTPLIFKK